MLTELDVAFERQKDVVRFDISVNDTFGMKVLKTVQGLVWSVKL